MIKNKEHIIPLNLKRQWHSQICYAPCTSCITEINNAQIHGAQDIDAVMPMYNLIEYNDVYSKISEDLWQYYREEPALDNNYNITDFPVSNNNSILFKCKQQLTE